MFAGPEPILLGFFFFLSAAAQGSRCAGGDRALAGLRGIMSSSRREKKRRKKKKKKNVHSANLFIQYTDSDVRRRRLSHQEEMSVNKLAEN